MRILHFVYGLKIGGAESFILNLLSALKDDDRFDFHFAIQDKNIINANYIKYFEDKDNKLHIIPKYPFKLFAQYQQLKRIIVENNIDVIHIHMNSFVNPIPILAGRSVGISVIVHSHNTRNAAGGLFAKHLHYINRKLFNYKSNINLACGTSAGYWMFNKLDFKVINNSIPIETFIFSINNRNNVRKEYRINENEIVIGHVGRFHPQKNHIKIIDIFNRFKIKHPKSRLLLIGDGDTLDEIKSYILKSGLDVSSVIFAGAHSDSSPFYSAMDVFLFPSLYEGLSIVGIEAQVNGLGIVTSRNVPQEMNISNRVSYINLESNLDEWVNSLENYVESTSFNERFLQGERLCNSEYSISHLERVMSEVYMSLAQYK